jgi:DNA-binding LacI/PurR family transcriptional regulator
MNKNLVFEKKKKVTIIDVAEKAGVAVATVSRVINGKDDVSAETRSKVLEVMMELNYVPSKAARILGGKIERDLNRELNSVGLILNAPLKGDPYYMHILNGIESELSSEGYTCIYSQLNSILDNGQDSVKPHVTGILLNKDIAGIINIGPNLGKLSNTLRKTNKPMVFVDSDDLGDDLNYVQANNIQGAKKAVSHLVSLGHRRIAFVRVAWDFWFFNELKKGYLEVLQENNIEIDRNLISRGQNSTQSGYEQATKLLSLENPPTAFFSNDIISIGIIKAIKDKGLRVPEDISVIGFDDIDAAKYIDPPLTTIQVPKREIGVVAAKKIIDLIKNGENSVPTRTFLPSKLIIRDSTGPASSKV